MTDFHIPVMCSQVLHYLITRKEGIYVDCTLGGGGHSREIIKKIYPDGLLIGIDQDIEALEYAREELKHYQDRIILIKSNFDNVKMAVSILGLNYISGILLDLGLSSYQVSRQSRGFSFMEDSILDMRMDLSNQLNAYYVINNYSESELWDIFSKYGEERYSRTIAREIVIQRKKKAIRTTRELAQLVANIYYRHKKIRWRIHPATKIFQALRIEVNNELEVLKEALKQSIHILENKGRICVISYHSLEDRIVKHTFKDFTRGESINFNGYSLNILSKKPIYPSKDEINENRRARSAKMRVAEKIF